MRSESVQQEWEESGEGVRSHRRQLGFCICGLSWSTGSSLYSKESLSQTKSLFQSSRSRILGRSHQTRHEKFLMVASLLLNLSCRCCPDRCSASYFLVSSTKTREYNEHLPFQEFATRSFELGRGSTNCIFDSLLDTRYIIVAHCTAVAHKRVSEFLMITEFFCYGRYE